MNQYQHMTESSTKQMFRQYKKAKKAGKGKDDVITFKGQQYVMGYMRYLLEYLGGHFPDAGVNVEEL